MHMGMNFSSEMISASLMFSFSSSASWIECHVLLKFGQNYKYWCC